MPGRWAGGGSPPSSTLPPLHKGGRPELMGAHHSRRDNGRVAWQEGSARKAWLPENFPVAGPGCPPSTRDSTEWLHSLSNSCGWWDTGYDNVEAIPTAEPHPGSLPTLLKDTSMVRPCPHKLHTLTDMGHPLPTPIVKSSCAFREALLLQAY